MEHNSLWKVNYHHSTNCIHIAVNCGNEVSEQKKTRKFQMNLFLIAHLSLFACGKPITTLILLQNEELYPTL